MQACARSRSRTGRTPAPCGRRTGAAVLVRLARPSGDPARHLAARTRRQRASTTCASGVRSRRGARSRSSRPTARAVVSALHTRGATAGRSTTSPACRACAPSIPVAAHRREAHLCDRRQHGRTGGAAARGAHTSRRRRRVRPGQRHARALQGLARHRRARWICRQRRASSSAARRDGYPMRTGAKPDHSPARSRAADAGAARGGARGRGDHGPSAVARLDEGSSRCTPESRASSAAGRTGTRCTRRRTARALACSASSASAMTCRSRGFSLSRRRARARSRRRRTGAGRRAAPPRRSSFTGRPSS